MGKPDRKVVYIPEDGKIVEWPTYGMTALRLMTVFPDPITGKDAHPSQQDMALAKALLTGDWTPLSQFVGLTPQEEQLASTETILWYDLNAPDYIKKIESVLSIDQASAFIAQIPSSGKILDVGCGGGRDCQYFTSHGYETVGIDLSQGMIRTAQKTHPDLKFIQASFLSIPFPDNSFEGLWSHASIHHLGEFVDVENSLKEFFRVLKRGGIIHLATQAKTGDKDTTIIKDTLAEHNRFYRYLSLSQANELLISAGFRILSITQHKETDDEVNTGRKNVEWVIALAIKD
jgi:ubiquinone/menaquinone biosynthesis C-methylase UbiE